MFTRVAFRRGIFLFVASKMPSEGASPKSGSSAESSGGSRQALHMVKNESLPAPHSQTMTSPPSMRRHVSDHHEGRAQSREERRKRYLCGDKFVTEKQLTRWSRQNTTEESRNGINERLCLYKGDITHLEIDAIVNAANECLMGGGGVDGSIHRAAGNKLKEECRRVAPCPTGHAKVTSGCLLPADYIIHTVGPIGHHPELLRSCYKSCFERMLEKSLKSVAFCCISTGIYGFPNEDAAHIALEVTKYYLENYPDEIKLVIFCCFLQKDIEIYERLMRTTYFPLADATPERRPLPKRSASHEPGKCGSESKEKKAPCEVGSRKQKDAVANNSWKAKNNGKKEAENGNEAEEVKPSEKESGGEKSKTDSKGGDKKEWNNGKQVEKAKSSPSSKAKKQPIKKADVTRKSERDDEGGKKEMEVKTKEDIIGGDKEKESSEAPTESEPPRTSSKYGGGGGNSWEEKGEERTRTSSETVEDVEVKEREPETKMEIEVKDGESLAEVKMNSNEGTDENSK